MARDASQAVLPTVNATEAEPLPSTENVFYLVPKIETELSIALSWNDAHPEVPEELITDTLELGALKKNSVVYVLARKPSAKYRTRQGAPRVRDTEVYEKDVDGRQYAMPVDPVELAIDMVAYGPVRCVEHWDPATAGLGRFSAKLNRSTFIAALAKAATPYAPCFEDVAIHTAAGDLPTIMCLRWA